eukprot:INCI14196.1.p2 GENE.INCI14196.1~~INCI14196.1.p2  ORF type:complete len:325 (-),score=22.85 INCI14196.1:314-1288(-)
MLPGVNASSVATQPLARNPTPMVSLAISHRTEGTVGDLAMVDSHSLGLGTGAMPHVRRRQQDRCELETGCAPAAMGTTLLHALHVSNATPLHRKERAPLHQCGRATGCALAAMGTTTPAARSVSSATSRSLMEPVLPVKVTSLQQRSIHVRRVLGTGHAAHATHTTLRVALSVLNVMPQAEVGVKVEAVGSAQTLGHITKATPAISSSQAVSRLNSTQEATASTAVTNKGATSKEAGVGNFVFPQLLSCRGATRGTDRARLQHSSFLMSRLGVALEGRWVVGGCGEMEEAGGCEFDGEQICEMANCLGPWRRGGVLKARSCLLC